MKKNMLYILITPLLIPLFIKSMDSSLGTTNFSEWDIKAIRGLTSENEVMVFKNFDMAMDRLAPTVYKELNCLELCQQHPSSALAATCKRFAMAKIYRHIAFFKIKEARPDAHWCSSTPCCDQDGYCVKSETPCNINEYNFIADQKPNQVCSKMHPGKLMQMWNNKLAELIAEAKKIKLDQKDAV